jgi:hypothetical protein
MNALVEDAVATLRRHGLALTIKQGPHLKIKFTNSLGSQCCLVVSRSPSDRSAIKKSRAELRRLLRRPAR